MATALVYVGIRGTVVALDAAIGTNVWATELKGSDFVSVTSTGTEVLAITKGEIFCLDPSTGSVRWHNPLRGYGRGLATVAGAADSGATAAAEKRRRDQAAAAAAAAAR
jgi:outer membrane protein assembly factor BamB